MMPVHYRALGFVPCIGLAMLLAGCHNDPASDALIARRYDNLAKTTASLRQMEARRPDSMAWTLDKLRKQHERDRRNAAENQSRVAKMIQSDFDRWEKNQPEYKEAIQRELKGNPDSIRRTAPKMAW